jgi:tetrapyrrole methylase family protein / MazG family protein
MNDKLIAFGKLLEIMDELRVKCPWDKEQTIESLRINTIEETYELADAIAIGNMTEIKKELGDLLLHIVFYSKIASETNDFDIKDVIDSLCNKLIFRHPHVFGTEKAENAQEVKSNWESLKIKEGNKSVLAGVPKSLPALVKAYRIQDKARSAGFDWEKREQVWDKVKEELTEFEEEVEKIDQDRMESEFGDIIFAIINAARLYNIDPEMALERTNQRFIKRFNYLEKETLNQGKSLHEMSLDEMNEIWEKAKNSK